MRMIKKEFKIFSITILLVLFGQVTFSCTVPVFQYALERWNQSYYDGVLLYEGNLTQKEKETYAEFQEMLQKNNSLLNLRMEKLDVSSQPDKYQQLLKNLRPDRLPALALWYPRQKGQGEPFWIGDFQMPVISNIVESDKRHEVSNHLVDGSPIVWMLIAPGGHSDHKETLNRLRTAISESVGVMKQSPQFKPLIVNGENEISFPVVTVSAENSEESVLLSMVTGLSEGSSLKQPMVVPVFGRGRALTTFPAHEIDEELIYNIMSFLLSPCACQIKMASPGTDMLIKAQWEKAFGQFASMDNTPALTSVMPDSSTTITTENDSIIDLTTDQHSSFFSSRVIGSAGGIIGILVVIIGIITVIILKRK